MLAMVRGNKDKCETDKFVRKDVPCPEKGQEEVGSQTERDGLLFYGATQESGRRMYELRSGIIIASPGVGG
jgi:hypothetical protein